MGDSPGPRRSLSIATRVSLVLAGLLTLVLFIAGAVFLWFQYNHEREILRKSNELAATQTAVSLSLPMWNYDGEQIHKILQGLLQDERVNGVALRDGQSGRLIEVFHRDARWSAVESNVEPTGARLLVAERPILVQEQPIGVLKVYSTSRFLEARMRSSSLAILGAIAFIDLLLILGIYGLFSRFVLSPLREMERFAEAVSTGQPARGRLAGAWFHGELGRLRLSLERMVGLLEARYIRVVRQAEYNHWLAQVLERFAGSLGADFDRQLSVFLGELAVLLEVETVALIQFSPDNTTWRATHVWDADGAVGLLGESQGIRIEADGRGENPFSPRERFRIRDPRSAPVGGGVLATVWQRLSCRSLLQVPLLGSRGRENQVRGALAMATRNREKDWTDEDEQGLVLFGNAVANALERRSAESALRESETRYRTLFENAGDAILILQGGVFTGCNARALQVFGCAREELLGRSPADFSPPLQSEGPSADLVRAKSAAALSGRVEVFEWKHRRPDGSLFDAEVTLSGIRMGEGIFLQALVRDVTEQKRALELKRRQTESLLQNDKIMALGELAAGMAHEITQPLSGISLSVQALGLRLQRGDTDPAALREGLKGVGGYVERISRLIEHVRMFSRDRRTEVVTVFDARQSVEHAVRLMGTQYANHGVRLQVEVPEVPLPVSGNLYELEQVLLNLLANAKYAVDRKQEKAGEAFRREISLRAGLGDGIVTLAVRDNGSGIPEGVKKRLFEPFFTTKPVGEGTGLGLSISLGIVQSMKGSLRIDSRDGEFTEVTIELPIGPGAQAAGGPP
ncbi:MAG: PAS domain S-box protein [Spirochaetes bacterium]|nr:PAS domain S-box protein [Spirochaetota bacterium]